MPGDVLLNFQVKETHTQTAWHVGLTAQVFDFHWLTITAHLVTPH